LAVQEDITVGMLLFQAKFNALRRIQAQITCSIFYAFYLYHIFTLLTFFYFDVFILKTFKVACGYLKVQISSICEK